MVSLAGRAARLVRVRLFPTRDLGLPDNVAPDLAIGDELPEVLALHVLQANGQPRIEQTDASGVSTLFPNPSWNLDHSATEGAGSYVPTNMQGYNRMWLLIEVIALTGSPTNIKYHTLSSFDGQTYYAGPDATVTAGGSLVVTGGGTGSAGPTAGNNVFIAPAFTLPPPPFFAIAWTFVGGTAPTVQHKIWRAVV